MNRRYFEEQMARHDLSLRRLATLMGMKHSQLSLTFSGARRLQLDEAAKLAEIFGVPLNVVATHAGALRTLAGTERISVTGIMRSNGQVEAVPRDVVGRIPVPVDYVGRDAVAVQARTADSPNSWLDGVVWICRPLGSVEEGIGRICWLTLADGREVIAVPRRGYTPDTYNLTGPYQAENAAVTGARTVIITIH